MKGLIVAVVSALALAGALLYIHKKPIKTSNQMFQSWKVAFGRNYGGVEEEQYRAKIWAKNAEMIKKHNLTLKLPVIRKTQKPQNIARPAEVDWRKVGKTIRRVKDQKSCGSCWAFSATGALEGIQTIKTGNADEFSEQQLVDCSRDYGNEGCNGGLMTYSFQYVRDHSITTEDKYPYVGRDQTCKFKGGDFKISSYVELPEGDIDAQADACVQQPISIAADATNWSFYSGGIFSNCRRNLNHGILLVGYKENEVWYVKNSWGQHWGEQGYIRLKWGNTCGCCDMSCYPVI